MSQAVSPPPASPADATPGGMLLLTFGLIGVFAFIQVYAVQAILPLLVRDFQASVVQAGSTVGATVLAVALTAPFTGMLSDAIGRKLIIVGSVFFLAVTTALMFFVTDIQWMILLRFLQGLAVPGITVVTIAYIGEEFRTRAMARAMSVYVAGTVLGGFLGRFLLGHLSAVMEWRSAFLLMAVANLLGALLVWRFLPASRNFIANPDMRSGLQMLGRHLRNRSVLTACALGVCVLFTLVGGFTYINLYLADAPYHLDTGALGNIFAVYLLGVVITPVAGRLLPRFGFRRTILLALGMSLIGLWLTLLPGVPLIVLALAIMSSGIFITQSATISFIAHKVETGRSLASGLYYMAYYSGGFLGAWLCGLAYARGHWHGAVAALTAALLGALLIGYRLLPPKSAA